MREKEEYSSLRQEIMQLQNNRFTVILGCITIDTAMLGWIASNPGNWYWEISSCLLIIFLICGCLLTWIMGRYTTKIAAFLEVFHEQSINCMCQVKKYPNYN